MIVRFTPAAEADLVRAVEWCEAQRDGLGMEFFGRVDEAVQQISINPLGYRKVFGEARRINLRQFPFVLWYKVEQDAIVIACLHAKRSMLWLENARAELSRCRSHLSHKRLGG